MKFFQRVFAILASNHSTQFEGDHHTMSSCSLCQDFLDPDGRHFYGIDIPSMDSLRAFAQNGCRSCGLLLRGVETCVPDFAKYAGLSMFLWLQTLPGYSTFILQLRQMNATVCSIEFFVTKSEY